MTVLALRLTGRHNGVSALHGGVSRKMWQFLWPGFDVDDVPIAYITNGVHTFTWIAPEMNALFGRYLDKEWGKYVDDPEFWNCLDQIPDEELWKTHLLRKEALIDYSRRRLKRHHLRRVRALSSCTNSRACSIPMPSSLALPAALPPISVQR